MSFKLVLRPCTSPIESDTSKRLISSAARLSSEQIRRGKAIQHLVVATGPVPYTIDSSTLNSMARIRDKVAYATLYCTRLAEKCDEDPYFDAVRLLIYQILHRPLTCTRLSIPLLVFVVPHVPEARRDVFRSEGASVIEIDYVRWTSSWIHPRHERWIDQLCKLRIFEQVSYDRILYLDADMLLVKCLDDIWSEPVSNQRCETTLVEENHMNLSAARRLPDNYLFVGVADTDGGQKPDTPIHYDSEAINGGFWLASPSLEMFDYYISLLSIPDSFDSACMEQGIFRHAHRRNGRMPWRKFAPGKWNVSWPRVDDLKRGTATLHDKFWITDEPWVEPELVNLWNEAMNEMLAFHNGNVVRN
jgi:alpha-N-acetylglucosamine transferase